MTDQNSEMRPPCPRTYLVLAVLLSIFCCFVTGIPAIVYSGRVKWHYALDEYKEAEHASKMALLFIGISSLIALFFISLFAYMVYLSQTR